MWTSSSLVSSCRWYEGWGHPNPHGTANLTSTLSPFTTLFHISVFFRAMCGSHENNDILQNSKALIYQELSHKPWAMSHELPITYFLQSGSQKTMLWTSYIWTQPKNISLNVKGQCIASYIMCMGCSHGCSLFILFWLLGSRLWYTCVACPDSMMKVAIIVYLL